MGKEVTFLVLGDMQVGNRLAIMPPRAEVTNSAPAERQIVTPNIIQKAIYKAWLNIVQWCPRPDLLIVNGEPIEGQQPASRGIEVWAQNVFDQMVASWDLLKLFNAKRYLLTRGTDYHTKVNGMDVDEIFGERYGFEKVGHYYAPPELNIEEDGVRFNIAHHIEGTKVHAYKTTAIAREVTQHLLSAYWGKKWQCDILIRGHIHFHVYVGTPYYFACTSHCWQAQTWYAHRKSPSGMVPDIGAIKFKVKNGEWNWDAMTFDAPHLKGPLLRNGKVVWDEDVGGKFVLKPREKRRADLTHPV